MFKRPVNLFINILTNLKGIQWSRAPGLTFSACFFRMNFGEFVPFGSGF